MLRTYKPINHKIFEVQKLIEYLVYEVWCKPDENDCYNKLNDELKTLYDNPRSDWVKNSITSIYEEAKKLSNDDIATFKEVFTENNKIKYLCSNPTESRSLSLLTDDFRKVIEPFFKSIYTKLLDLTFIQNNYGTKKEYYNQLITDNKVKYCPCCGYGDMKTIYEKGYSAYDHYLPQKHYPFSTVNFNNLVPLCDNCNSSNKGDTDILSDGKKVHYPLNSSYSEIEIELDISEDSFQEIIIKTNNSDLLEEKHIKVNFSDKSEETESWDTIFGIRTRYFGKIAGNRANWIDDVREVYRHSKIVTESVQDAFDLTIELKTSSDLGFLKVPFLKKMKSFKAMEKAIKEVTGDSIIS